MRVGVTLCCAALALSAALLLVTVPSDVHATPAGFTTYFYANDCPSGWYPLVTSRGRLIVSVADPSDAGVTVGVPLSAGEDRAHNHSWSSTVNLPSKSVAAIDCCNNQGAQNGNYPVGGATEDTTSALPFVQLPLCTLANDDTNPVPFGTIAFFDPSVSTNGCPAQWSPMTGANGRAIVPGYADKGIITSDANPLKSGEDRTHSHSYTTSFSTVEVSYAGIDGCCNSNPSANGQYTVSGTTSEESSGIPYLQLLTCLSQAPTFDANFPPATLLFNEVGCPPAWNISLEASGRFVVGLPEGAEAGVTFGGQSLAPGAVDDPEHAHHWSGSFNAGSAGVGLASGCCGGGYAASQTYSFEDNTAAEAFAFPYLSVPMCMQL